MRVRNHPFPANDEENEADSGGTFACGDAAAGASHARRNLAETFDELYAEQPAIEVTLQTVTPSIKQTKHSSVEADTASAISPTGVAELNLQQEKDHTKPQIPDTGPAKHKKQLDSVSPVPYFFLHAHLKRELPQSLVNRVSFYSVIHDINKEANAMVANDHAIIECVRSMDEEDEVHSPLVVAVNGRPKDSGTKHFSIVESAMVDEETWLLKAIEARKEDDRRSDSDCPATFLQAMGEREYDNPLSAMETSRTQLWKPSRSWWEAKSGKNPWIEPKSHNKRWRYLWPLIHYHKFLAKCIKKLKRNSVDVKTSVSPVAVFLREEVCQVSDHLASVSLFTSEQWMECLQHFEGWIDTGAASESKLRGFVSELKLRPIAEPGDVDSPLLRTQIDNQFLRTMVAAREQMSLSSSSETSSPTQSKIEGKAQRGRSSLRNPPGLPLHPQSNGRASGSSPRGKKKGHLQSEKSAADGSQSQHTGLYHAGHSGGQWWPGGWSHPPFVGDETSVHSTLSGDSGAYHYASHPHGMYAYPHMQYVPPPPMHGSTPDQSYSTDTTSYMNSQYHYHDPYAQQGYMEGWYGGPGQMHGQVPMDHGAGHIPPHQPSETQTPLSPTNAPTNAVASSEQVNTPSHGVPASPYWDHLQHSTLAMTGIYTPAKPPPSSPQRENTNEINGVQDEKKDSSDGEMKGKQAPVDAHPLLINSNPQAFPYGMYSSHGGYAPPSPATQFMMPPQGSSSAYYGYNMNGSQYYMSPHRGSGGKKRLSTNNANKSETKSEAKAPTQYKARKNPAD